MFVSIRGGAYSRAGTLFCGQAKQPASANSTPPRIIPNQFSVGQGYILELGDQYLRVIANGGYIVDLQGTVSAITQANPAQITANIGSTEIGAASATVNTAGVTATYAPGDLVTLKGGLFTTPTQLDVSSTALLSLALNTPGAGVYAPADTVHLTGGTQSTAAVLTVVATQVTGASVASAGSGGGAGPFEMIGTTGTGARAVFICSGDGFGGIASVTSISASDYTVNPTSPSAEPITGVGGGAPTGATLDLSIGILTFSVSTAGVFTANPAGGAFTQASSSGSGTGATFQGAIFGPHAVTVAQAGVYSVYPTNPVAQESSTGIGAGATFTVTTTAVPGPGIANGDWIALAGIGGMTEFSGRTVVAQNVSGETFDAYDTFGNPIDSTAFPAYTTGGTGGRIFTLATPYAASDLPYLKFAQSADLMSLTLSNPVTDSEYPPQDLDRLAANDWTLTPTSFGSSIAAPATCTAVPTVTVASLASSDYVAAAQYAYCVTAIDADTGEESVASPIGYTPADDSTGSVDISVTAGSIVVTWATVPNAASYNIYKAPAAIWSTGSAGTATPQNVPIGSAFGFAGSAVGTQWTDQNVVADFTTTPPLHLDPFAPGQIFGVTPGLGGHS